MSKNKKKNQNKVNNEEPKTQPIPKALQRSMDKGTFDVAAKHHSIAYLLFSLAMLHFEEGNDILDKDGLVARGLKQAIGGVDLNFEKFHKEFQFLIDCAGTQGDFNHDYVSLNHKIEVLCEQYVGENNADFVLKHKDEVLTNNLNTKKMEIKIKKLDDRAITPTYAKQGDMGMDLTAIGCEYDADRDVWVYHTGLAFEIPDGYGMLVFPRSSNRNTDCYMPNSVGVVDSGYRGEVLVCFKNRDWDGHTKPYNVGDRVAQAIVMPYPQVQFTIAQELSTSERGTGGHGSTGK